MKNIHFCFIFITIFFIGSISIIQAQSCADGSYNFVDDIAPILNSRCAGCHGSASGFNVSTYANVLAGGNNCGPGVTPGNATAAASSLINKLQWAVGRPNADCGSNMPRNQSPITEDQFFAIESWIAAGAPEECSTACPPDFTFTGSGGLTGSESGTVAYETDGVIESNQLILNTASVNYDSATEINLLENFEVEFGAEFHAFIDGCL